VDVEICAMSIYLKRKKKVDFWSPTLHKKLHTHTHTHTRHTVYPVAV